MRGSRIFVRGGPTLTTFFVWFFSDNEGGRIYIPLKVGHHRLASETPFKWRFAGGPMMARHWMLVWFFMGSGPVLPRNPICDFSGGGVRTPCPPPPPPQGSEHANGHPITISLTCYVLILTLSVKLPRMKPTLVAACISQCKTLKCHVI